MNNNKQSSVEWLFEQISRKQGSIFQIPFYIDNQYLLKQAKAMHKEEIIDAHRVQYDYSYSQIDPKKVTGEQYYNETFGGNNEQQ